MAATPDNGNDDDKLLDNVKCWNWKQALRSGGDCYTMNGEAKQEKPSERNGERATAVNV